MMKPHRLILGSAGLGLALLIPGFAQAHGNEHGQAKASVGGAQVTIEYNRPMLKGRDLGKLIQPGQIWRIGADAPTTLESDTDLDVGGTRVPKGKHILLARCVDAGHWVLIVSSKSAHDYEPSAKLAEAPLELRQGTDPAELVTIQLSENGGRGVIEIAWGTLRLVGTFAPAK